MVVFPTTGCLELGRGHRKVMAMSVLVSGVALDEVMVGDLCGEEVAHVVRILLDRCMAACDWDAKRT